MFLYPSINIEVKFYFIKIFEKNKVLKNKDSPLHTEFGLSLNGVTKPAFGVVPSLRGIQLCSRCHAFYSVFDIKKFFRSVRISNRDSYLRIVCVPSSSFSTTPSATPSWTFYRDRAIPFGNSASGDYAACARPQLCSPIYPTFPLSCKKLFVRR